MAEGPREREERADPLGREDRLPGEEREPLGSEDRLPGEERVDPLGREDPLPREERRSETENTEKESLIDKAKRKLKGL